MIALRQPRSRGFVPVTTRPGKSAATRIQVPEPIHFPTGERHDFFAAIRRKQTELDLFGMRGEERKMGSFATELRFEEVHLRKRKIHALGQPFECEPAARRFVPTVTRRAPDGGNQCRSLRFWVRNRENPTMAGSLYPSWGATMLSADRARFRIWAPDHEQMRLALADHLIDMEAEEDGWFSAIARVSAGTLYQFVLPDGTRVCDPASRAQAGGVEGPSILTAQRSQPHRQPWLGRPWREAIISEIHIGTFTSEGTFLAAIPRLAELAESGITAVEIMPVAQFAGTRGWGYDGVLHFAPHNAYGPPQALKTLVDAAHSLRMMVLLDVVYNHFGPIGNAIPQYAERFFDHSRSTPWGMAIAFDEPNVRRYFLENALYWLTEFGFDGLRLDAVQHIRDTRNPDFPCELAAAMRKATPERHVHLIAEDGGWRRDLIARGRNAEPSAFSASWNDDFHHAIHTMVTGEKGGHYRPFADEPSQILSEVLASGFRFGSDEAEETVPAPVSRVAFLQNHDQVGNRASGDRLRTLVGDDVMEVLTSLLLLSPQIPLLFMGDDYGETRPFHFFADCDGEFADAIRAGRPKEAENFGWDGLGGPTAIPDPISPATFYASKLDWSHAQMPPGHLHRARLRELSQLRLTHIAPLCGSLEDYIVHPMPDGAVAIDWHFSDGTFQIRANLSQTTQPVPGVSDVVIWAIGWLADERALAAPGIVVAVGPPAPPGGAVT